MTAEQNHLRETGNSLRNSGRRGTRRCGPTPRPSAGARVLGLALMCCGIGVALWLLGPSLSFPAMTEARSGSALSPGLDTLRALGLTVTGVLLFRGDPRRLLVAAATAASLVVGAWLGVLTASPGTGRATALTTALGAELPLATLCVVVTVRCLTRRDTAAGRRGTGRRDPLHPEPPGPSS